MSRKLLCIGSFVILLFVNGLVLGTLYFSGVIWQPTAEAIEAARLAEEKEKQAAEDAIKYAHLEPLPGFKSRANYVASMGEAISICEKMLHEKEPGKKSWAINYIESRFLPAEELYKVFLDYETIVSMDEEPKIMKVTCDVEEATKMVSNWGAMKAQ
jgi:hypothetical protein